MSNAQIESSRAAASEAVQRKEITKAVAVGAIGNVLEWFDFGVYGYFAPLHFGFDRFQRGRDAHYHDLSNDFYTPHFRARDGRRPGIRHYRRVGNQSGERGVRL